MSAPKNFTRAIKVSVYSRDEKIFEQTFTSGPITFGRNRKARVPLEFDFVSRAHCHIVEEEGNLFAIDLGSSNGIRVAGEKTSKISIQDKTTFSIGHLIVDVEVMAEAKKSPAGFVIQEPNTKTPLTHVAVPDGLVSAPKKMATTKRLGDVEPPRIRDTAPSVPSLRPLTPAPPLVTPHSQVKPVTVSAPSQETTSRDFIEDLTSYYHGVVHISKRRVESVLLWHDQVYDVREFSAGQTLSVGTKGLANLPIPTIRDVSSFAQVTNEEIICNLSHNQNVTLYRENKKMTMGDLLANQKLQQTALGYRLTVTPYDVAEIDFGHNMTLFLRYVPPSKALTTAKMIEPEQALKQSIISSLALHVAMLSALHISRPKEPPPPKFKNIPERIARLLVQKPKPTPAPTPIPTPEPKIAKKKLEPKKEIVKKRPEPKKIVKEVPKVFKTPKAVAKVNKFPMEVKKPEPKAPPPVKVESLGALAALGALAPTTSQPVTNININKNAGGANSAKINTGGIVGALPSSNGRLVASTSTSVKTKGGGFGTGEGYGVQGLKSKAGSRAVAGAIVGEPKLASNSKLEGLTRAQVMAVVQKYLADIQHCYEKNLLMNPNLAGRMEFEWDIASSGSVTSVRVKRSTVNSGDQLGECVKGVFSSMAFPKATNGQTTTPTIGFPFGRL